MRLVLAGFLAVSLALLWDRALLYIGVKEVNRVGIGVPLGEELLKYTLSLVFSIAPPLLYAAFGLGEGLYETFWRKNRFNLGLLGAGVVTHLGFGVLFLCGAPSLISLSFAIVTHIIWNSSIIKRKKSCNKGSN